MKTVRSIMSNSFTVIGYLIILLGTTQVSAVTLSLEPSVQTAMPGDTVTLDLVIDDLGDLFTPSLGDFDIDIAYDTSALSLSSFSLGSFLGNIGLGEAIDFSLGDLGGGIVNVVEVSYLEPDAGTCVFCIAPFLDDIQPDSFSLATFVFDVDVLDPGTSTTVSINTVNALGDGFGIPLVLDSTSDAVIQNPSIPEPTTLALMGLGLASIGYRRHRSKTAV